MMIKKIRNFKFKIRNCQAGMSYTELIVVLGIFAVMTSIVLFDYNTFQDKVDIKNLAVDIASKLVEAQKSAMSGKFASGAILDWKPSYGLYFSSSTELDNENKSFNQKFIYFPDLNNDKSVNFLFGAFDCGGSPECLGVVLINKGNHISSIIYYPGAVPISDPDSLSIIFTRPSATANFYNSAGTELSGIDYVEITISSPDTEPVTACIQVYPSGRIQIKCTTP